MYTQVVAFILVCMCVGGVIPTTLNELAMNSCFALCMIIMTYNIIYTYIRTHMQSVAISNSIILYLYLNNTTHVYVHMDTPVEHACI